MPTFDEMLGKVVRWCLESGVRTFAVSYLEAVRRKEMPLDEDFSGVWFRVREGGELVLEFPGSLCVLLDDAKIAELSVALKNAKF